MKYVEFSELLGLTLKEVIVKNDLIYFITDNSRIFKMYHKQDCCETVCIDDIAGDMSDLIGLPLLTAEEVSNNDSPPEPDNYGTHTWTFYKLATFKGHVVIRWFGESNGFYSESVDFEEMDLKNDIFDKLKVK